MHADVAGPAGGVDHTEAEMTGLNSSHRDLDGTGRSSVISLTVNGAHAEQLASSSARRRSSIGVDALASPGRGSSASRRGASSAVNGSGREGSTRGAMGGMPPRPESTTSADSSRRGRGSPFIAEFTRDLQPGSGPGQGEGKGAPRAAAAGEIASAGTVTGFSGSGSGIGIPLQIWRRISAVDTDAASFSSSEAFGESTYPTSPSQSNADTRADAVAMAEDAVGVTVNDPEPNQSSPDRSPSRPVSRERAGSIASGTGSRRARRRQNRRLSIAEAAAFPNPGESPDGANVRSGSMDSVSLEAMLGGVGNGTPVPEGAATSAAVPRSMRGSPPRSPLHRGIALGQSQVGSAVRTGAAHDITDAGSVETSGSAGADSSPRRRSVEIRMTSRSRSKSRRRKQIHVDADASHDGAASVTSTNASHDGARKGGLDGDDDEGLPLVVSYRQLGVNKSTGQMVSYQKYRLVRIMKPTGASHDGALAAASRARARGRAKHRRRTTSY